MTVISLTNCPSGLRGDLTKWLQEINTGVYVGNVSSRVRDELWERIVANIRTGQATMVFRAPGEQHLDFRVHNTTWQPVDYDGLKLMRRPSASTSSANRASMLPEWFSNAAKRNRIRQIQHSANRSDQDPAYTILDLETTGLDTAKDEIIEIGALRVRSGEVVQEFNEFVLPSRPVSEEICSLTGITENMLVSSGRGLRDALSELLTFIGSDRLLCWNSPFDYAFLQNGCSRCGLPVLRNKCTDVMKLSRRALSGLSCYKLTTVAQHLGIDCSSTHRALPDCYLTLAVFRKLNES